VGCHQFGIGHYFFGGAISDDAAFVEQHGPVGDCGGEIHIGSRDDEGLGEACEQLYKIVSVSWVETAVGFVEGDYLRGHREYSCNCSGPFLA